MRCSEITSSLLQLYLERSLLPAHHEQVKSHLDNCQPCWGSWNRFRWDRAQGTRGYMELQQYLGDQFQPYLDSSWALAHDWDQRNPQTQEDVEAFYRETPYYLYNLMIWHESGNRSRYVAEALPLLAACGCQIICDFGCGIGTDGLLLLEQGYEVIFCEFDNLCSQFLRWRLQQRQLEARWVEPHEISSLTGIDTLWMIDVLDHLPDPQKILHPLLKNVQICIYEADIRGKSHGCQRFHWHHEETLLVKMFEKYGFERELSERQFTAWQK